jgi:hypothetical protein
MADQLGLRQRFRTTLVSGVSLRLTDLGGYRPVTPTFTITHEFE